MGVCLIARGKYDSTNQKILFANRSQQKTLLMLSFMRSIWRKRRSQDCDFACCWTDCSDVSQFRRFQNIQVAKDRWEETVKKFKEADTDISIKVDTQMGISSVDLVSDILIRLGNPVEEILKAVEEEDWRCDRPRNPWQGIFSNRLAWERVQFGPCSNPETSICDTAAIEDCQP